jgi:hypothetical protein
MRILIYKRTHRGDPDASGIFGIHDCTGRVRDYHYDAVIGVGGIGHDPQSQGISGKINWIGIGPHKFRAPSKRATLVSFDHFLFFDTEGLDFRSKAPTLAPRIYDRNIRLLIHDLTRTEHAEAMAIVTLAKAAPPSRGRFRYAFALHRPCARKLRRPTVCRAC